MGCGHIDWGTSWGLEKIALGGTPSWQTLEAKGIRFFANIRDSVSKKGLSKFRAFTKEVGKFTGAVEAGK